MTISKIPALDLATARRGASPGEGDGLKLGELSGLLGYALKRAQVRVSDDFSRCVAPLQLTPARLLTRIARDFWRRLRGAPRWRHAQRQHHRIRRHPPG